MKSQRAFTSPAAAVHHGVPSAIEGASTWDLIDRALSAHYARHNDGEPTRAASTVCAHDGLLYVRLAGADGYVATYRVHNDGLLRLMKQPPPAVVLGEGAL